MPSDTPYAANSYNTPLNPVDEMAFRQWVQQNNVPFDPNAAGSDYNMRAFYQRLQGGDPRATTAVNPDDNRIHYPDTWKTPSHETFSNESIYAGPDAQPPALIDMFKRALVKSQGRR